MNLYRFRIELTDAPGSLAAIARAFAAADANICEFDVQTIDGQVRADELLVEVAPGNDAEALAATLNDRGFKVTDVRSASANERSDVIAKSFQVAAAALRSASRFDEPARWLTDAASRVVRCDRIAVVTGRAARSHDAARRALESRCAAQVEVPTVPSLGGPSEWSLAVPVKWSEPDAFVVLTRDNPRFSYTEAARVEALVSVLAATLTNEPAPTEVTLADGGVVDVRPFRSSDVGAFERLMRRCEDTSGVVRSALPVVRNGVVGRQLATDPNRTVVAACGSELLGVATARGSGQGIVVVDPGHRRRGIANALRSALGGSAEGQALRGVQTPVAPIRTIATAAASRASQLQTG
ncbi:MAG: hypothetical protein R2770_21405 [Acidimicrobiales bacterium]|nr:hypothetical protein [Acidimicrobiales bacterium]